jgi:hypothetical protein
VLALLSQVAVSLLGDLGLLVGAHAQQELVLLEQVLAGLG